MTAQAAKQHHDECIASGMNDYVTKPIDATRLIAIVSKWIEASRRSA